MLRKRLRSLGDRVWDKEKKAFVGRNSIEWVKLCFFYAMFYLLLAGLFIAMTTILMVVIPKDRPLRILGHSTMAVLTPLNPGLGFRPHANPPHTETIILYFHSNGTITSDSKNHYVKSLNDFLEPYKQSSTQVDCPDRNSRSGMDPKQSCQFHNSVSQCDYQNGYGYDDAEPCILIKLNRIYGWTSGGAATCPSNEDKSDGKGSILGPGDIRIKCAGETAGDIDVIRSIRYFSYNGDSVLCGDIPNDSRYFPFRSQPDYLSPYVWAKFDIQKNVLISIVCKAYADNIDSISKVHMRGMLRFKIIIANQSYSNPVNKKKPFDRKQRDDAD